MRRAFLLLLFLPAILAAQFRDEDRNPAGSSSLTWAQGYALAGVAAAELGEGFFVIAVAPTGSMVPALDSRSILIVESIAPGFKLRVNDICLYTRADVGTVCHRATVVRDDGWTFFAGDANSRSDGWINPRRIVGRVVAIIYTERKVNP